jgi:hypothetical protein
VVLERMGGVMVYDITVPENPSFVQYINNRIFNPSIDQIESGGHACDLLPPGRKQAGNPIKQAGIARHEAQTIERRRQRHHACEGQQAECRLP